MKATGIVRNLDNLGRLVIPKELRRNLGIEEGDPVEFFVDGEAIIVKKFDSVGDVAQMIDNFEKILLYKEPFVGSAQAAALLGKTAEMRAIINQKK